MTRKTLAARKYDFIEWRKKRRRRQLIMKGFKKRWKEMKADTTPPDTTIEEDAEAIRKWIQFRFSEEDALKIAKWQREHKCCYRSAGGVQQFGAFGDGYGYYFVPSSMGIVRTVTCACGADLDLSLYS